MFDDLIETLKSLVGMKVSVPAAVQADKDGYIDRQYPATECEFLFKVHQDDWFTLCGMRRSGARFAAMKEPNKWWTHGQVEKAKKAPFAEVKHRVKQAMRSDAERWNRRRPRDSFISMTLKVDAKPKEIVLPAAISDMQLRISCSQCACRYAVIDSAYFCAACSHNAAEHVFAQTLASESAVRDA